MYSEKVMDHFTNPRNVGVMDDADGIGEEGNPVCGDAMKIFIKVKSEIQPLPDPKRKQQVLPQKSPDSFQQK